MIHHLARKLRARKWQLDLTVCRETIARIHALEGGTYLVEASNRQEGSYVTNRLTGAVQQFYALDVPKQCVKDLGIVEIEMALDTPYDQMIGLQSRT